MDAYLLVLMHEELINCTWKLIVSYTSMNVMTAWLLAIQKDQILERLE